MDYFFEHHSATLVFFVHEGGGTLETTSGPSATVAATSSSCPRAFPTASSCAPGPQYYWMYESFAGDPEKAEAPTTGQFITHSRSDYRFPRTLDTRNEAGRFEIVSKVGAVYTRRVHPTHPFDVVGWRGDYLPYRFAVEDVRPLTADRSHVPPSGHTDLQAARLLPLRLHRALRREGRDVAALLPSQPRLLRDASATTAATSSAGAAWSRRAWSPCIRSGCPTAPSRPRSRRSWTASARTCTTRSASWPTSPTRRRSRSTRWGCRSPTT